MSISRKIVEHALADNGDKVRSSIYSSINEKVADLLESKKIELAGGSLVSEENTISEEAEYILEEMERTEAKIEKLKEQIAILEAESCDMDDSDDEDDDDDTNEKLEKKKKKLKKKEKKMAKLKEAAFALIESEGEIDQEGEWSEEESEEGEEESDEESN
jgi:hypothetical protein